MPKSNVLILCSDEHARAALGCYGHPVAQTPTLDALAARGVRFTRAYTPSPICIPARASLATGLNVHETRCWSSAEPYHGQIESWMHRLRDRGHPVTSIGKLHFRSGDDDHGFDEEIEPMYLANDGLGWPQGLLRDPLPTYNEVT
jgi:choline-sulfatase